MTNVQINKLSMMFTIKIIVSDMLALYSALPNFSDLYALFEILLKDIQKHGESQVKDVKGLTDEKEINSQNLIGKAMQIIRKALPYATKKNLTELKEVINYTESFLKKTQDVNLIQICRLIYKSVEEEVDNLNDYGITKALLDDFNAEIDLYESSIGKPRAGIVYRKDATTAIKKAFKETDEVLAKMDEVVDMLKKDNPEAYSAYMNGRIIVDYGKGKKNGSYSISGMMMDFGSGLPLAGVKVSIVGTDIVVVTKLDGLFVLPVKVPGEYKVMGELTGYKQSLTDVTVTGKDELTEIEMERENGE
jgi:hypothetical protein